MLTLSFANGDTMPGLGLGTWKSDPGEVYAAVQSAIRAGYRHIDCAYAYGNEAEIGRALKSVMAAGVKREDLWITSKLWNSAHQPADVEPALQATLHDLGLRYLDLYLMHWPVALRPGVGMPASAADFISPQALPFTETWSAMQQCLEHGLTRHIGVSNFSARKLQRLLTSARIPPEMNQIELHPYLQQNALLAWCREHRVRVTAYSPLGSVDRPAGLKSEGEPVLLADPTIEVLARQHQASPAQVLIAWALQRGTAVIPKSVHAERIRENLAAAKLVLSAADLSAIARLDRCRRYLDGGLWTLPGSGYTRENLWDE